MSCHFDLGNQEHTTSLASSPTHVHALHELSEDSVPAIEVRRGPEGDEELRAVRVRSRVGHRQQASPLMRPVDAFICVVRVHGVKTTRENQTIRLRIKENSMFALLLL